MKAVIWAAVSSRPQVKAGRPAEKAKKGEALDSIEQQIEDATKACEAFGWDIVSTLVVPGHSRNYVFYQDARNEIPAYADFESLCKRNQEQLAHGRPKLADVLVCRARDRLGRTDALVSQVEELARRAGIQVFSLSMPSTIVEPGSTDNIGALYVAAIERARAQDQVLTLRHFHAKGMRSRVKRGLPSGNVPYGYRRVHKLPPAQIPQEIATIRLMCHLYLKGWGHTRIAGHLNGEHPEKKPRRSSVWRGCTIREILQNRFYAGMVRYKDVEAMGQHVPVWTPAEWAKLETERRRRAQTRGKAVLPYSGLVRCMVCGGVMSLSSQRKQRGSKCYHYCYYRCSEGWMRHTEQRGDPHRTVVRAEKIRDAVLEAAQDPDPLQDTDIEARRVELERARSQWQAALDESVEEVRKLLEAYGRWGNVSADAFDAAMAEAAKRQDALKRQLAEVTALLEATPTVEERQKLLEELASSIGAVLELADVAEANAWLSQRIRAVWCRGSEVERVELV